MELPTNPPNLLLKPPFFKPYPPKNKHFTNSKFIVTANSNYTANFIIQDDCYTKTGCNIINSTYWDNANAFNKPEESTFIINNIVIPSGKSALLIVGNSLIANQLEISFPTNDVSSISLQLNSSVTVNGDCKFANVELTIEDNGSIMSSTIEFVNSIVKLLGSSSISTATNLLYDTADVTIDVNTQFTLYDSSSLNGNTIISAASLLMNGNARIQAVNIQLSNGIVTSLNSTVICNQLDLMDNGSEKYGSTYIFYGSLNTSTLITPIYNPKTTTKITLKNSSIGSLQLFKSTLISTLEGSNGLVTIGDAVIDGNITVSPSTSIRILPLTLPVVFNGVFTIMNNTNSYLSNVTFPPGSIQSPVAQNPHQYSNITIEEGTVDMQEGFSIYGKITLKPDTTLLTTDQLILEKCITSEGMVDVKKSLVCPNGDYNQLEGGSLVLHEGSHTYIYMLFNDGLIDVVGENVILQANVVSDGVFQIQPDCFCEVHGYMDLLDNSILDIGGIGPNTIQPALSIYNSIGLNGTLNYNISAPPTDMDSIYYLIDSNIELSGNFSQFIPTDPSFLDHYNIEFSFVNTQSSGSSPGSLEIHFNFAENAPKKINSLWIALGIIIPLVVIAILVFGVYRFRKSRQYKDYTQLLDPSSSSSLNNDVHKDNDDL
ncbi:hypothetical protein RB653_006171 [Dictyostelium firmibasis]|uniref:Uncharacterized protein n=1 Tax=Dictyostelium firmibasis TaxID=79012 RepID=A0AAN7U8I4_9MYCE